MRHVNDVQVQQFEHEQLETVERDINDGVAVDFVDETADEEHGTEAQPVTISVTLPPHVPQVQKTKKDDGELIVIKLRDLDGMTSDGRTIEFVIPAVTTILSFLEQVTSRTKLSTEVVNVVYQTKQGDAFDLSHFPPDSEFSVLGIYPSREKIYSLCLMKKKKARVNIDVEQKRCNETVFVSRAKVIEPEDINVDDDELLHREFVGLKNQQQTCYLNSLLQSLFFCPEFRNFIYNQTVPYDPQKKSLILALQKIFLQLQFSVRTSIETEELTRTFGWKEDHNFIQHDIEELYRALLEYLGDELKRAGQPSHGDSLFGGVVNDYVKCLECKQQNSKLELSLGISLPVRAFGEKLAHPTVEEALKNFVQVEVLNHPNQYRCERCSALVDAEKGTAFQKLPYFLSLQLRRWEFDLTVLARRKINDRISFPFVLNMDPFMPGNENGDSSDDSRLPAIDPKVIGSKLPSTVQGRLTHSRPQAKIKNKDTKIRQPEEKAAHAYELLAVWVHEGGSSHRGHYYSYVYDLEKCSWYLCNDSFVRKASEDEIMGTFGGKSQVGDYEREKGEAYMLIYRRRDPNLNTLPMTWDDFPEHIKELWGSMEQNDRKVHEAEIYEKRVRRVRLCRRKSDGWEVETMEAAFEKSESMQNAAREAYKILHPNEEIDLELLRLRLVRFNLQTLTSEDSWEGMEEEAFGTVVRGYGGADLETVLLEASSPERPFQPYASTDGVLKVDLVNWNDGVILRTSEVHIPNSGAGGSLQEIQEKISTVFEIPVQNLTLACRTADAGSVLLTDSQLIEAQFQSGSRFVEIMAQNVEGPYVHDFLEWSSEYFGSYCFYIESQVVPKKSINENRSRYRSETEPQFEFDPLETTSSEGQASSESPSGHSSRNATPTRIFVNGQAAVNGHEDNENKKLTFQKSTHAHYFCVQTREKVSEDWEKLKVRASPLMTLLELSQCLSLELNQPEDEFILFGVTGGHFEVEYTHAQMRVILRDLESFESMKTKVGHRLGPAEFRVSLYLLDFSRYKETPPFLTEVVLHSGMSGSEVKESCVDAVRSIWSHDEQSTTKFLRIRKKKSGYPGRIIRDTTKFRDIFLTPGNGELFVQPIQEPDSLGEKEFRVLIRHWQPSRLLLAEPFEIKVTHDYSEKIELLIRDEVAAATSVDPERLEYVVPELDVDYPYDLSPLTLQEKVTWRKFGSGRILNVHTDQCAIIIRDLTEIGRELTRDERRKYANEIGQFIMSPPRKLETGLCINLARTPPQ